MCGQDQQPEAQVPPYIFRDDFPWHLGVYDVHNHIGERVLSSAAIPGMRARGLAIMATRSEDQDLVAEMAASHGLKTTQQLTDAAAPTHAVPGFGRHPWFSHSLYDDTVSDPTFTAPEAEADLDEAKAKHYRAVLTPAPDDMGFIIDLPTPEPLSVFISETRQRLRDHPLAIVGEIGLDKAFRLPQQWDPEAKKVRDPERTPGGRERRPLSRQNISMAHQQAVLRAQLKLAGEMGRAVSVHGVQVHGILYDLLVSCWKGYERKGKPRRKAAAAAEAEMVQVEEKKEDGLPYPPRICLHSFSGKAEAVRQYLNPKFPAEIFFSFCQTNNLRDETGRRKMEDAMKMVPDDRVLIESDIHTAGDRMDSELEETYRAVCEFKGWSLEEGVARIADNYQHFIFGQRA